MTFSGARTLGGRFCNSVAVLLAASLAGCAIDIPTDPDTFSLEPNRISHLRGPQTVALNNAYMSDAKSQLKMGPHTWIFDVRKLTDTSLVMLRRALEKQGLAAAPQAEKTIALRVRILGASMRTYPGFAQTTGRLTLEAQFGDGTGTSTQAENTSPMGAQRVFDGAVLFALNQLLVDEKFVAYMNR